MVQPLILPVLLPLQLLVLLLNFSSLDWMQISRGSLSRHPFSELELYSLVFVDYLVALMWRRQRAGMETIQEKRRFQDRVQHTTRWGRRQ